MDNNTYTRADYDKEKKRYQIIKDLEDDMFISRYVVEVLNRLPDETDRDKVEVMADIWWNLDGKPREYIGKSPFDEVVRQYEIESAKMEAEVATWGIDDFAEDQDKIESETTQIKKDEDNFWNETFADMPDGYGNPIDYIATIPDREYGTEADPEKFARVKELNRLARVLEQSGYGKVCMYCKVRNDKPGAVLFFDVPNGIHDYRKTSLTVLKKMLDMCDMFGTSSAPDFERYSFSIQNVWKSKIVIRNPRERLR